MSSARLLSLAGRRGVSALAAFGRAPGLQAQNSSLLLQRSSIEVRGFASAAGAKVAQTLQSELKHEQEQYEQPKEIASFLKSSGFKFVEEDGDVNMMLEREMGDKVARIEWQLTSPYAPDGEMEGEDDGSQDATDFVVTVETKDGTSGVSFYCSTQGGEDHRYIIGHVKNYSSSEEKESVSSYNGPDFEDIDDKLQGAFDEYLGEVGMNNELCDFIDAVALDKEQREYIRWLQISQKFLNA
jgi:complement component 1 Q subcomponent-binding protein